MADKTVIIKVKNSLTNDIIIRAKESFNKCVEKYYNTSTSDKLILREVKDTSETFILVMVLYSEYEGKQESLVDELLLGYGNLKNNSNIIYTMKKLISSRLVIDNFVSNSEIDLKEDFGEESYLLISHSKILIEQLEFQLNNIFIPITNFSHKYKDDYKNIELADMAQHNKNCLRVIGTIKEHENRNEFQRDRERITNSKSFRRLVDKAQIFTSSKGDHYRTRMTHTLEVSQIARAISSVLKLNVDLTEAIALAHDLGHTPFGHQGERTLDNILKNKYEIIDVPRDLKTNFNNQLGGFKHNYQGLRVLTVLEEKYVDFTGLDISVQVLEGVLKHTKLKLKNCTAQCKSSCSQDCFNIYDFINNEYAKNLHLEYNFATTLEGQVVAIADEIAQRGHDVDDAFLSGLLTVEEFLDYLKIESMKQLEIDISKSYEEILNSKRTLIDEKTLFRARIISNIVNFFINDVLKASEVNMKRYQKNNVISDKVFKEILIDFSTKGKRANNYLEKVISKKAINSSEVSKFDNNAEAIILGLFKAYYDNPKLLHKDYLKRIYFDYKNSSNKNVSTNIIDFINGDFKLVKKELNSITRFNISKINYSEYENLSEAEEKEKSLNLEYWEKRKILVKNIVDYISGMTDNYAINEYNSISHKTFL